MSKLMQFLFKPRLCDSSVLNRFIKMNRQDKDQKRKSLKSIFPFIFKVMIVERRVMLSLYQRESFEFGS